MQIVKFTSQYVASHYNDVSPPAHLNLTHARSDPRPVGWSTDFEECRGVMNPYRSDTPQVRVGPVSGTDDGVCQAVIRSGRRILTECADNPSDRGRFLHSQKPPVSRRLPRQGTQLSPLRNPASILHSISRYPAPPLMIHRTAGTGSHSRRRPG